MDGGGCQKVLSVQRLPQAENVSISGNGAFVCNLTLHMHVCGLMQAQVFDNCTIPLLYVSTGLVPSLHSQLFFACCKKKASLLV